MVLKRSTLAASSSGGSSASNDFTITTGSSGYNKTTLSTTFPAGNYVITSSLSDTSMDIYLIAEDRTIAGAVNTLAAQSTVAATKSFKYVVIYGATNNDTLTFQFKYVFALDSDSQSDTNAGPRAISVSASNLNPNASTTITGRNFASNATVTFTGSDNVARSAKSVTRNSSTSLTVVRPDTLPAQFAPYTVTVTNPDATAPTSSNVNKITSTINTEPTAPTITGVSKLSGTQASVTFTAPTYNGNSAVTNYKFSTDGVNYTALSPAQTTSPLTITVTTNTTYSFYIKAVNAAGDSVASNQSSSIFIGNPTVSGGTLSNDGTYFYRTFNSSGTFIVQNSPLTSVEYLIVGGGGSGGSVQYNYNGPAWECGNQNYQRTSYSGGGGGGGVQYASGQSISVGSYSLAVGGAGSSSSGFGVTSGNGSNGGNDDGGNGGSSGSPQNRSGGSRNHVQSGGTLNCNYYGDVYTVRAVNTYYGGGGGGAGSNGSNGSTGEVSGGSGLSYFGSTYGAGGSGGRTSSGVAASANTGNGGGGGTSSGTGGSGRIVIRYPMSNVTNA